MRSNRKVRAITGLAVVAIASAIALGTWSIKASGIDVPATLTISGYFTGSVTANAPCKANRQVKVKRSLKDAVDTVVSSVQTDASGAYTQNVTPKKRGAFYAQVYPTKPDSYGYVGPNRCLGAKSAIKTLPKQRRRHRGPLSGILGRR